MLPEHKNPIFVSKRPKISEKSPILTQKCQFCARKAGKWGSRSQKAHKKADFVLGGHHRTARSGSAGLTEEHGAARRSTDQHGETQRGREKPPETGQDRLERSATARSTTKRNRHATNTTQRNTTQHTQHTQHNTTHATQLQRNATAQWGTTKKETTFRVVSFVNWRLPTLPHGSAVPSAQVSLTSLFGMGRGGSSPLLPP